jgi:methylenetetrahydrofolate reductase (NADPH)
MVCDRGHLDALLDAIARAGIDDLFLVAGDSNEPLGQYASGLELLPVIDEHPLRPQTIGIPAYPEGHPLIDAATLDRALLDKSRSADYITTQLCFHPDYLLAWVRDKRAAGIRLPVYFGVPGKVHPRKLLELSIRIGVGQSIGFVRKQHGFRHLIGRSIADKLLDELGPSVGDAGLGIAGFHYVTFNELRATWEWSRHKHALQAGYAAGAGR